jgi:hypothetical protein
MPKPPAPKTVETLRHEEDKRANIPTAEYERLVRQEEQDWSNLMILGSDSLQVVASLAERGNLRAGIAE